MVRSDDAASPSISIALSGIAGGAASKLLSPDDGTYERYYRQTAPQAFYVNRLTPTTYPATLKTVRIYFGETRSRLATRLRCTRALMLPAPPNLLKWRCGLSLDE